MACIAIVNSVELASPFRRLCAGFVQAGKRLEDMQDLSGEITFGGVGLDRAADLRLDSSRLANMQVAGGSRHIVLWRGKLLVDDGMRLCLLGADAKILSCAAEAPIFLGLAGKDPVFVHDVSSWEPPDGIPDTLGAFHDPSVQVVPDLHGRPSFREIRSVMAELSARDASIAATAKAMLGWHSTHTFCAKCGVRSDPAMAGWRRDCPACGGQHFPRTDPVVIMLITRGNSVLLGRSVGWPDGLYSLLAGFVEPGETVEDAVRREVFEETSVRVGPVRYLASQPWPFPSSMMIGCAGIAETTDIQCDAEELEDAMWMTKEEVLAVFAGQNPTMRAPRKGAIAGFLLEEWLKDRLD